MSHNPMSFQGVVDARVALAPIVHPQTGRTLASLAPDASFEELEHFWDTSLWLRGLARQPMETVLVRARVDHGRWLADCPNHADAALVVPGFERACCLGCGAEFCVVFPSEAEIEEAERVLRLRPVEQRNWRPSEEPVDSLSVENVGHGLPG